MRNTIRFGAVAAASALVLAACGTAPEEESTAGGETEAAAESVDFTACMVSDAGGFDDKSFNQSAYEGLTRAESELGIEIVTAESNSESDFGPNLEAQVAAGCDLIITVGFLLSQATVDSALANPDVHYAIIDDLADNDFDGEIDAPNIKPITFETDEAAFLAGYAAASATQTGTVGTFGGLEIPSVTIFMEGYAAGVEYYNQEMEGDVQVLGLNSFSGGFDDQTQGQNITQGFLDQGADIVMPVAGPVGLGAASAIQSAGNSWLVGVDSDWTETAPEYSDIVFTSVLKNIANAVFDTIDETVNSGFSTDAYLGNLENEGVGVSDFAEGTVGDDTLAALDEITAGIIAGDIEASGAE
ncbi:BMP family lipoprotein [Demequina sediminicola]|uniref:BMP family lipoprotein n=1 Tax=Demequina sediminicola TaxID=1095026 RepID=UPI0007816E46|nr:BMP family ABC transporter substrate-binding protein [Demequina sediminicola]